MSPGGNPGGFLWVDNSEGPITYIFAPAAFLGDLSGFDGGAISFDGNMLGRGGSVFTGPLDYGHLRISNGGNSVEIDLASGQPLLGAWTTYSASFDAATWGVTPAQWASILSNVTEIRLSVEARFGAEVHGIDNVVLAPASPITYCTAGTSASGCNASLLAAGTASATAISGFSLNASNVEGAKDGIYFFGTNGRQANPWGNGTSFQCVVPPVTRGPLLTGSGTSGACNGSFAQDLNAFWCPSCPKPQKNPGAGALVQAQLWYRDPQNTSNQTTSLSDAVEFCVYP